MDVIDDDISPSSSSLGRSGEEPYSHQPGTLGPSFPITGSTIVATRVVNESVSGTTDIIILSFLLIVLFLISSITVLYVTNRSNAYTTISDRYPTGSYTAALDNNQADSWKCTNCIWNPRKEGACHFIHCQTPGMDSCFCF